MTADISAPMCAVHPEYPAAGACPRCGAFACRACLRSDAGEAAMCFTCAQRADAQKLPWDERHDRGTMRAFLKTSLEIMQRPKETLARARPEGTIASSLGYTTMAALAWMSTTMLAYAAIAAVAMMVALSKSERSGKGASAAGIALGVIVAFVAFGLLLILGSVLIGAGLDHLVLRMIGARPKPFEVTLRAHALSYAPSLLGVIPLCGAYVVPLWAAGLRVIAYKAMHQLTTAQALAGALVVPGLLTLLLFAGYVVMLVVANMFGSL